MGDLTQLIHNELMQVDSDAPERYLLGISANNEVTESLRSGYGYHQAINNAYWLEQLDPYPVTRATTALLLISASNEKEYLEAFKDNVMPAIIEHDLPRVLTQGNGG